MSRSPRKYAQPQPATNTNLAVQASLQEIFDDLTLIISEEFRADNPYGARSRPDYNR